MVLEIDIGNTRVKWRLSEVDTVLKRGSCVTSALVSIEDVNKLFKGVKFSPAMMVYIATVVARHRKLFSLWAAQFQLTPVFAQSAVSCGEVLNAYDDVSQMGVDRWLVIVAAYKKVGGACLVVDAGSAITVDMIDHSGRHLGGYIVPGLQMMRRSLFGQTDQVKHGSNKSPVGSDECSSDVSPGSSTGAAVASGLSLMLLGMVRQLLLSFCDGKGVQPFVLLTGGDGSFLVKLLCENGIEGVELVPDLVMDGLSLVINE